MTCGGFTVALPKICAGGMKNRHLRGGRRLGPSEAEAVEAAGDLARRAVGRREGEAVGAVERQAQVPSLVEEPRPHVDHLGLAAIRHPGRGPRSGRRRSIRGRPGTSARDAEPLAVRVVRTLRLSDASVRRPLRCTKTAAPTRVNSITTFLPRWKVVVSSTRPWSEITHGADRSSGEILRRGGLALDDDLEPGGLRAGDRPDRGDHRRGHRGREVRPEQREADQRHQGGRWTAEPGHTTPLDRGPTLSRPLAAGQARGALGPNRAQSRRSAPRRVTVTT